MVFCNSLDWLYPSRDATINVFHEGETAPISNSTRCCPSHLSWAMLGYPIFLEELKTNDSLTRGHTVYGVLLAIQEATNGGFLKIIIHFRDGFFMIFHIPSIFEMDFS